MTLTRYSYTTGRNQENFYSYMYVFTQYDTKQLRNLVVRVRSLWNGCVAVCRCTRCRCQILVTVYRTSTTVWSTPADQPRWRVHSRSSSDTGRTLVSSMSQSTPTYDQTTSKSTGSRPTPASSTSRFDTAWLVRQERGTVQDLVGPWEARLEIFKKHNRTGNEKGNWTSVGITVSQ